MANPEPTRDYGPVRDLILGGTFDFLLYLSRLENPLVVGKEYPRDKLIEAYEDWARENNITVDKIEIAVFRFACEGGHFS